MGDTLDAQVQSYVRATRSTGGMITTTVVLAAGEALVRTQQKNFRMRRGIKHLKSPLN